MFSGIVEAVGTVGSVVEQKGGVRFTIQAPDVAPEMKASDSICINGACLTVVRCDGKSFDVELVPETLSRTTFGRLKAGSRVNLERSVSLEQRLGGHLVSGHVDAVGKIVSKIPEGQGARMRVEPPATIMRYIVEKGSVSLEGVSLTVAAVSGRQFEIALIPYTLDHTTLGELKEGDGLNIEADMIAKYVERLMIEHYEGLFIKREFPGGVLQALEQED